VPRHAPVRCAYNTSSNKRSRYDSFISPFPLNPYYFKTLSDVKMNVVLELLFFVPGDITGSYTETPSSDFWERMIFLIPNGATNIVMKNFDYNNDQMSMLDNILFATR
jgi:hypothetical protein